jgi:hypothetical protein
MTVLEVLRKATRACFLLGVSRLAERQRRAERFFFCCFVVAVVVGNAFASDEARAATRGAKIILLQQPGLPTRANVLGSETTADTLNGMDAAGFTITTYDFETGIGTEYGLMKDARPVSKEVLKEQLAALPEGITKEVYIEVLVARPGDLFDDNAWNTVIGNFMNLAQAANELNDTGAYNFKGIVIDNEEYRSRLFSCADYRGGQSCQEQQAKMFEHGKNIMRSILKVWPEATVTHMHGPYSSDCARPDYIAGVGVGCFELRGPFFAGMVQAVSETEGANPVINGGQDYVLESLADFQKHYDYTEAMGENGVAFIPPSLRPQWAENVDTSFMIYNNDIDYNRQTKGDSRIVPYATLEKPKTKLANARCVADNIVWFYIEDAPETRWYYAMPDEWREQVLLPALASTC